MTVLARRFFRNAVLGAFIFGMDQDTPEKLVKRAQYIPDCDVDVLQATQSVTYTWLSQF